MIDKYGEVINHESTYKEIVNELLSGKSIIIGWTDEGYDHRDIMFVYKPTKMGLLQRGLNFCYLFVSIIGYTSYGFLLESDTDNRKNEAYLIQKLRLKDNRCDKKICELINGVIAYLDKETNNES